MDLRQLRYFVTIAETQSLSKAGERLHIAQPALSLQLASLEDELSTRLFDRRSRGVTLTENGTILLRHAMHILQSVNNAVSELKTQDISIAGRVVIGFTGTVAAVVATRTIRQVRRKYPNVLLTVMESSIRRLVEQLERDELDLAIVVNELDRTSINVQAVAMEDFCLYGARDASDGTTSTDWVAISQLPLLLSGPANISRQIVDQAARASGVRLVAAAEIDTTHLQKEAVLAGLGYSILPRSACLDNEKPHFWVREIVKPNLQAVISLASSKVRLPSQAQEAVKGVMLEICHDLVEKGVWKPPPTGAKQKFA